MATATTTEPHDRLYALDLLRFVAAAMVMGYHGIWYDKSPGSDFVTHLISKVTDYGWMGVELFFLISGFVICMSSWGRTLSQFFTSRIVRLLPAYIFAVAATALTMHVFARAASTIAPSGAPPDLGQILGNLTMVHQILGIQHLDWSYWTLLVELKFYLCFAILVGFGLTYRRVVLFCVVYTTVALFAAFSEEKLIVTFTEPGYVTYFVAGITLYLIHRFGSNLLLWGIYSGSAVLSLIAARKKLAAHIGIGVKVDVTTGTILVAVFFVVMAAIACGWFAWMRWRGLAMIGALTYPIYLIHQTNGWIMITLLKDRMPAWLIRVILTASLLIAAYLIHRLIERPVGNWLKRRLRASFEQIRSSSAVTNPQPAPEPSYINPSITQALTIEERESPPDEKACVPQMQKI